MTHDELLNAHPLLQSAECGVSVPHGWIALVHDLMSKLEAIGGVRVDQIKQKFGSLRVYVAYKAALHNAEVDRLIDDAEDVASRTCEVCGADGKLVGYRVRCSDHRAK